jgi:glucosamine--fructose-6-phosphate aminotransferase (isomerizing)
MCGMYGHIKLGSSKNSARVCLDGLKKLEYRGYDSAGIAGISNGRIISYKTVGKVAVLDREVQNHNLELEMAIAHTRWATHGSVSEVNAHPHYDQDGTVAMVHNGIIENFQELKSYLQKHDIRFYSETDTEVISQLVAFHYKGDFLKAVQETLPLLEGSFAFAIIHQNHPNEILAAARGCPLIVGIDRSSGDTFLSSDSNAFPGRTLDVFYLYDDEIVHIAPHQMDVFGKTGMKMSKKTEILDLTEFATSRGEYEHFLLKEIHEQPAAIQRAIENRIDLKEGSSFFPELTGAIFSFSDIKSILILACGSSYHAGYLAASIIETMAHIPTRVEIASEFRYRTPLIDPSTLVIAISQSGETADTLGAIREIKPLGAPIIAICNVEHSSLSRDADATIFLRAGPEISVCCTKAFTSQVTVLLLLALKLARFKRLSLEEGIAFIDQIKKIPEAIEDVLKLAPDIQLLATRFAEFRNFFFVGRNYMFPVCLEGALKLKEIAYFESSAYPAGEMKHGPIALISPELPTIALCGNKLTFRKLVSNLMEIRARGGPILAFAPSGCKELLEVTSDVLYIPDALDDLFSPIPYTVATQLFAYYVALSHDRDIDQPRNLAKAVTVE